MAFLLSGPTQAASLNEQESLRLGLERSDFQQLIESRQEAARSDLAAAEVWPNPELEFSREELAGETETAIWLRQDFDLSGRRALNREAARTGIEMARLSAQARRAERGAEISSQFYQTLYQQRIQALLGRWMERFANLEQSMISREEAGDVSGYDRLRISQERASLLARQREELAAHEAASARLMGMLGLEENRFDDLSGELRPAAPPLLGQVLDELEHQPALETLRQKSEVEQLAVKAAGRAWIPALTLGLGQRRLDGPQNDASGLAVSAGLSLPLFDRGEAQRQKARAQWRQTQSEYRLELNQARSEAQRRWRQAGQRLDNARLYEAQSLVGAHELLKIAETAYQNNELGVLELIDAYRAALEADLTLLRLELEARLSRIELDSLLSGVAP
jgi:cobalt-zinc-cadmium efflux system outer membrane protein